MWPSIAEVDIPRPQPAYTLTILRGQSQKRSQCMHKAWWWYKKERGLAAELNFKRLWITRSQESHLVTKLASSY